MALSPIQTYKAIKEVINSENALGNISDAIKQDYTNRINKLESEYEKAGIKGSYNAGLEAGKLTADVASLFAGGASIAKGGVILTEKVAAKVGYKVLKDPIIISDKGIPVTLDGHKIYDPQFTPLSTNPEQLIDSLILRIEKLGMSILVKILRPLISKLDRLSMVSLYLWDR